MALTGYRMWMGDEYQQRGNSWMLMVGIYWNVIFNTSSAAYAPLYGWRSIFGGLAVLAAFCIIFNFLISPKWQLKIIKFKI